MPTKQEHYQQLFHRYQQEHGGKPETPFRVVEWALAKGLLSEPRIDPKVVLAEEMARALREEIATDASGRRYRRNHAVRYTKNSVQLALWVEIETAPREHMVKAFQQRRKQIVGDCFQLKTDVDVYNNIHPEMVQIPLVLDFTDDVAELEVLGDEGAA